MILPMRSIRIRPQPRWDAKSAQLEVIAAGLAFALAVPVGKVLLADASPLALSGTLYLSAGLLCLILTAAARRGSAAADGAGALQGADWRWLGAAVLAGAVLAPLLLFLGLARVSGHVAGLLLNFEAVFTAAIAVLLSGERLGRRGWLGTFAILAGAAALSLHAGGGQSVATRWTGIAMVIGACALWGLDNNFTQRVSIRDARRIAAIKGLAGGVVSLLLALAFGGFGHWTFPRLLAAATVGAVSFGLSLVLFVRGLRRLGVLQTGMLFALAPGFAAILSWMFLRETIAPRALTALGLMTAGALLIVVDRHEHMHVHMATVHSHEHVHDAHHRHPHDPGARLGEPHTHPHSHDPLTHAHGHAHDVHHRHRH